MGGTYGVWVPSRLSQFPKEKYMFRVIFGCDPNSVDVLTDALFAEINKMEKKEIGTMVFTEYKDRFQLFIGLALFLLFVDLLLLNKRNKWSNHINLYK